MFLLKLCTCLVVSQIKKNAFFLTFRVFGLCFITLAVIFVSDFSFFFSVTTKVIFVEQNLQQEIDKREYPKNSHVVFCPNNCLDLDLIFHRFSPFNRCLSVVLYLITQITPKIRMLRFVLINRFF